MNNPIVLLSPSKGMGSFPSNAPYVGSAAVPFAAATHEVVMRIQALSADQRQHLFKVSDNLFQSVERIWSLSPSEYIKPSQGLSGLFAYTGEAFKSFDAHSLGHNALQRAKKSLVIVSALYGIVTGEMNIVNYRLEMQSKLPINGCKNLYSLWKPILTEWLNNQESSFAVNLCSTEYSKVFEWKSVRIPTVHVDFKQMKNGELKSVSAFSKQARGTMARWIFSENIQTIFSLASFDLDGYRLYSHEGDKMVFLREA
jgi:cytoplasmic iron level regulating protein YaaA (DUF328/UPF0246 family)